MPKFKVETDQGTFRVEAADDADEATLSGLIAAGKGERLDAPEPPPAMGTTPAQPPMGAVQSAIKGVTPPWVTKGADWMIDQLPTVGAFGGGLAGMAAGGPAGPFTAPIGAGAGAIMGRNVQDLIKGQPMDLPSVASEGITGAAGEMGGLGLGKAIEKAVPWVSKKVIPFVKGANEPPSLKFKGDADDLGITTSAAERSGSPTLAQLETLPTRAPFGAGTMREMTDAQLASQKAAAQDFAFPTGKAPAPSAIGAEIQATLRGNEKAARAAAGRLYDRVASMAGDQPVVEARSIAKVANEIVSQEYAVRGVQATGLARTSAGLRDATLPPQQALMGGETVDLQQLPVQVVKQLGLDQPKALTFESARLIQSRLGAMMATQKDRFVKMQLGKLHAAISEDIDTFGQAAGGDISEALTAANGFFKKNVARVFVNEEGGRKAFVSLLQKAKPEEVVNQIRTVSDAANLRAALGATSPAMEKVQRAYMQQVVEQAVDPKTGVFRPQTYLALMDRTTPEFRRMLFGDTAPRMEKLLGVLRRQVQFSGSRLSAGESAAGFLGAGQVYGGAGGMLYGLVVGSPGTVATGAVMTLTPVALAKALTSPRGIRLLTQGATTGPGTAQAARLASQLAAFGSAENDPQQQPAER